ENSASHVGYPQSTHKPLSIASPAADFGSASVAGQTPAPAGNSVYVSNSVPAVDSNPGNRAYRERSATVDNPNVTTSWKGFIKQVASTLPFVSAILNKARFKEISEHALTFELYGTSFEMTRVKGKINDLEQICKTYFGKKLKIDIINKTSSQKKFTEDEKSPAKLKQAVLNHPIVVDAVKIFNGTIVDVNTG
ncbi:MAG: hypothetical protein U9N77_16410, partial [Thermodesulfobacteriota bacterium]|nr:hypothetical protein [Thermodesulfobacteriota bacterium]